MHFKHCSRGRNMRMIAQFSLLESVIMHLILIHTTQVCKHLEKLDTPFGRKKAAKGRGPVGYSPAATMGEFQNEYLEQ